MVGDPDPDHDDGVSKKSGHKTQRFRSFGRMREYGIAPNIQTLCIPLQKSGSALWRNDNII